MTKGSEKFAVDYLPGLARWKSSKKTTTVYIGEQLLTGDDYVRHNGRDWGKQRVLFPDQHPQDLDYRPNKGVVLLSYNTPIMIQDNLGDAYQVATSFSNTTAKHKRRAASLVSKGPVKTVSYWEFLGKLAEVRYQGLNGWLDQVGAASFARWQFLGRQRMSPRQALEILRGQLEAIVSVQRGKALLEKYAPGGYIYNTSGRLTFWRPEVLNRELDEMERVALALEKVAEGESTLSEQQAAFQLLGALQ